MRGLRPGLIEHQVKKIALDNSNNHVADTSPISYLAAMPHGQLPIMS